MVNFFTKIVESLLKAGSQIFDRVLNTPLYMFKVNKKNNSIYMPPENIRKPKLFKSFQGLQNRKNGVKMGKLKVFKVYKLDS